jgi:hypothetical protein
MERSSRIATEINNAAYLYILQAGIRKSLILRDVISPILNRGGTRLSRYPHRMYLVFADYEPWHQCARLQQRHAENRIPPKTTPVLLCGNRTGTISV